MRVRQVFRAFLSLTLGLHCTGCPKATNDNHEAEYSIGLRTEGSVFELLAPAQLMAGSIDFEGRLSVTMVRRSPVIVEQRWRLLSCDRFEVEFGETRVSQQQRACADGAIVDAVVRDGRFELVAGEGPLQSLFEAVVGSVGANFPVDPTPGTRREFTDLGEASAEFTAESDDWWSRRRGGYRRLSGFGAIHPSDLQLEHESRFRWVDGLDQMTMLEHLATKGGTSPPLTRSLHLSVVRLLRRPIRNGETWEAGAFDERQARDGEERWRSMMLQQRGDLTMESLSAYLTIYAAAGPMKNHQRLYWQSLALVRLDDEANQVLVKRFGETASIAERALILDIFAGGGTQASADALVQAMAIARTDTADEGLADLARRFGLHQTPSPAMVAYVEEWRRSAVGVLEANLTYSLGAMAGRLGPGTDAHAKAIVEALRSELSSAGSERRQIAIGALGNANPPSLAADLVRASTDPDWRIRLAVARALRNARSDEARALLARLGEDSDESVAREARISAR